MTILHANACRHKAESHPCRAAACRTDEAILCSFLILVFLLEGEHSTQPPRCLLSVRACFRRPSCAGLGVDMPARSLQALHQSSERKPHTRTGGGSSPRRVGAGSGQFNPGTGGWVVGGMPRKSWKSVQTVDGSAGRGRSRQANIQGTATAPDVDRRTFAPHPEGSSDSNPCPRALDRIGPLPLLFSAHV